MSRSTTSVRPVRAARSVKLITDAPIVPAAPDNAKYLADVASAAALLVANEKAAREEAQRKADAEYEAQRAAADAERKAELAKPLAQKNGAAIFAYFQMCAADVLIIPAAALYVACKGKADRAAALLGDNSALLAQLHMVTELMSVMCKAAPREFFGDEFSNTSAIRIGDLHANAFGLSKLVRLENKAALKDARTAARKLIEKAD